MLRSPNWAQLATMWRVMAQSCVQFGSTNITPLKFQTIIFFIRQSFAPSNLEFIFSYLFCDIYYVVIYKIIYVYYLNKIFKKKNFNTNKTKKIILKKLHKITLIFCSQTFAFSIITSRDIRLPAIKATTSAHL